jgi:NAD(P)-dependent dehydrogenase (short-subunit alcohol dehydrogenase family)
MGGTSDRELHIRLNPQLNSELRCVQGQQDGRHRADARNVGDLGKYGITVNAVSPAFTPTPGVYEHGGPKMTAVLDLAVQMTAIKRVPTPDDVVGLVIFLSSDAAAFITGQTILADGGRSYF